MRFDTNNSSVTLQCHSYEIWGHKKKKTHNMFGIFHDAQIFWI